VKLSRAWLLVTSCPKRLLITREEMETGTSTTHTRMMGYRRYVKRSVGVRDHCAGEGDGHGMGEPGLVSGEFGYGGVLCVRHGVRLAPCAVPIFHSPSSPPPSPSRAATWSLFCFLYRAPLSCRGAYRGCVGVARRCWCSRGRYRMIVVVSCGVRLDRVIDSHWG
jgi:hypothetical protein